MPFPAPTQGRIEPAISPQDSSAGRDLLIFTSCGYSLANRGDLAMLEGFVRWVIRRKSNLRPLAYAHDPTAMHHIEGLSAVQTPERVLAAFHARLPAFVQRRPTLGRLATLAFCGWLRLNASLHRTKGTGLLCPVAIRSYFSHVRDAHAVVLSGGGYLNSVWWLDGLYAKAWMGILAKVMGRPLLLTSQGLGPFEHWLDRFVARRLFHAADFIGVRDEASARLVKRLSGTRARVAYSGDDALLGDCLSPESSEALLHRLGVSRNRNLVGVNFRDSSAYAPGYPAPTYDACAAMLDRIVELTDADVIFVPISYHTGDDDRESAAKVKDRMRHASKATNITEPLNPLEIRSLVGHTCLAVGMSYHFLLFALSASVPALGVYQNAYYRRKLLGLFDLYGIPERCASLVAHSEDTDGRRIHSFVRDSTLLRRRLKEVNERLEAQSARGRAELAQWLSIEAGLRS